MNQKCQIYIHKECNCLPCVVSNSENHLWSKWSLKYVMISRNHLEIKFSVWTESHTHTQTCSHSRKAVQETFCAELLKALLQLKSTNRVCRAPEMHLIKGDPGVMEKILPLIHHPSDPQKICQSFFRLS